MDCYRKEEKRNDGSDALSLEERVQRLEDRQAVEAVLVSYAHQVDARDAEGVAELFTEDGQLQVPGAAPLIGRARIAKVYGRLLGALKSSTHVVSNFEVAFTAPDCVAVTCVLWAWEGFDGSLHFGGAENRFSFGRYAAQLVREEEGRWRMASLAISFAGQEGGAE